MQTAAAAGAAIAGSGTLQTGTSGGDVWVYLNGRALNITAPIIDNGTSGLTYAGTAALTLSGVNTYAGPTTIEGTQLTLGAFRLHPEQPRNQYQWKPFDGSVRPECSCLGASNQLSSTAIVSIGGSAGSKFDMLNFSQTIAGLQTTVAGTAALVENNSGTAGTSTLTLNNSLPYTFDGIIRNGSTGLLAFTKTGSGKFTLTNTARCDCHELQRRNDRQRRYARPG